MDIVESVLLIVLICSVGLNLIQNRALGKTTHHLRLILANYKADAEVLAYTILTLKNGGEPPEEGVNGENKKQPHGMYG
jgi:hypothetical protein